MRHFVSFFSFFHGDFGTLAHQPGFLNSHSVQLLSVSFAQSAKHHGTWSSTVGLFQQCQFLQPSQQRSYYISHHCASTASDIITDTTHITKTHPTDLHKLTTPSGALSETGHPASGPTYTNEELQNLPNFTFP